MTLYISLACNVIKTLRNKCAGINQGLRCDRCNDRRATIGLRRSKKSTVGDLVLHLNDYFEM